MEESDDELRRCGEDIGIVGSDKMVEERIQLLKRKNRIVIFLYLLTLGIIGLIYTYYPSIYVRNIFFIFGFGFFILIGLLFYFFHSVKLKIRREQEENG